MSNSPLVNVIALSPNHSGKRTKKLCRITPHCYVGQVTAERIGKTFASSSTPASCNYGIAKDGRVVLVVDESNRSWCTSSNDNDQQAITIECASDSTHPYAFTDACYEKLVELCIDICRRNGKKRLLWLGSKEATFAYTPKDDEMVLTAHRWFKNKACPGDWMYSREEDLANRVTAALNGGNAAPAPAQPTPQAPATNNSKNNIPAVPFKVQVKIDDLNYRSEPSMKGVVKGQTGKGVFTIAEVRDGWGRLKSNVGWIYLENPDYLTIIGGSAAPTPAPAQPITPTLAPVAPAPAPSAGYKVKVNTAALHIRKGPGTNHPSVGIVHMNEIYTIVDESNGFGKLKSGAGWISLKYTKRI